MFSPFRCLSINRKTATANFDCFFCIFLKSQSLHCTRASYERRSASAGEKKRGSSDRIDLINILSPLVSFSFHPVTVQVHEQLIDVLCACRISCPFSRVKYQELLVFKRIRVLDKGLSASLNPDLGLTNFEARCEMVGKIICQVAVQI